MRRLASILALLLAGAVTVFVFIASITHQSWLRETTSEINAEVASLEATSALFPTIGALDPVVRRARADAGFYLILDLDGERIDGNILSLEDLEKNRMGPVQAWSVTTARGPETVYGRWVRIDNAIDILVARSPRSFWRLTMTVGAVFLVATLAAMALAADFAAQRLERDEAKLKALAEVFEMFAQGKSTQRPVVENSNSVLDRLTVTFNKSFDRISAFVDMLNFMDHFLWHEVMAPVGRARQEIEARPDYDESFNSIIRHLEASEAKSQSLLEVARYETRGKHGFETVDLVEVTRTSLDEYEFEMENRDMQLQADLQPAATTGLRGAALLLIDNLVKNAVAYGRDGTAVEVTLRMGNDQRAILSVADRGPGLKAFPSNFDFQSGPQGAQRGNVGEITEGHGVGLLLVYRTARLLGVDLRFEDRQNSDGLVATATFSPENKEI